MFTLTDDQVSEFDCQTDAPEHNDFWCIVSAVFQSPCSDGRVTVLKFSGDAAYHCLFENDDAEDCGLDCSWWRHPMPEGIYRLRVDPWAEQDPFTGEWNDGVRVLEHNLICELPKCS